MFLEEYKNAYTLSTNHELKSQHNNTFQDEIFMWKWWTTVHKLYVFAVYKRMVQGTVWMLQCVM